MIRDIILIYLVLINVITFVLYGMDKWKAKRNQWRIKESVLLGMAAVGGCFGALAGMYLFRHKTQKAKFYLLVPIFAIIYVGIFFFIGSL